MSYKIQMIESLLESLGYMEQFKQSPEEIAPQFAKWMGHVRDALDAAGLNDELEVWNSALKDTKFSVDSSYYDLSMLSVMSSLRAILNGFVDKFGQVEPSEQLFPLEITKGTRNYVEEIARQANGCYERGWYDPCAVMLRRLVETLIIECFEKHLIDDQIKDADGNYFLLKTLIDKFLIVDKWHMSRTTKQSLPHLKKLGDLSAHNPRFLAKRHDIKKLEDDIRIVVQELVYISELS